MACRIEPGDGRIITSVAIWARPIGVEGPALAVEKELIADSGGVTLVPLGNLKPLTDRGLIKLGPLQDSNFGPCFDVSGATMEVEVEQPDGTTERRTCPIMKAHVLEDGHFLTADGLLGMDQLDRLRADPVKNRAGDRAFLRPRT